MKKWLIIVVSVVLVLIVFRYQTFFVYVNGSDICYMQPMTDYIKGDDGATRAYQNNYMVVESKGVINFIFPYSKTTYTPNPDGKLSCNTNAIDEKKVENEDAPVKDVILDVKLPNTKVTTTYMCDDKVKIVEEQDSPSLPPRISYLRVSDNAGIAYYGDMGAYIRPEYFSIDRAQIEQGYSFNEINFCKYLKN